MTKYALTIEDQEYRTTDLYIFTDERLWNWLNAPEKFDKGESVKEVTIPGEPDSIRITIGSPNEDKAHALAHLSTEGTTEENAAVVFISSTTAKERRDPNHPHNTALNGIEDEHIFETIWY